MMSKKVLIIDGNNFAYRAKYAYPNMSYEGLSTSLQYGVITMVRALIHAQQPDIVEICWDDRKHWRRMELNAEYKGHRQEAKAKKLFDKEDFYRQLALTKKALTLLGITQIQGKGMEADDYIYIRARKYHKKNIVAIASGDKDFAQCLTMKNVVLLAANKKNARITAKNCTNYFKFEAHECVDYLVLDGDKSDDIQGYRGMGDVSIRKFLDKFGSISSFLEDESNVFPRIDRKKLLELYQLNRELIDLEYFYKRNLKGTHEVEFIGKKQPKLKLKKFYLFCSNNNFTSLMKDSFVIPFKKLYGTN